MMAALRNAFARAMGMQDQSEPAHCSKTEVDRAEAAISDRLHSADSLLSDRLAKLQKRLLEDGAARRNGKTNGRDLSD